MELTVINDSWLKLEEKQSSELTDYQKFAIKPGRKFIVVDHDMLNSGHIWVKFDNWSGPTEGYFWAPDVKGLEIIGNIEGNEPKHEIPNPDKTEGRGRPINIPGEGVVYLNDSITPGGNFSWAEATKGGTRIPIDRSITGNIIKTAKTMQEIRKSLGNKSITVNSWYRDPVTNRRVGGASRSRHLKGDAVDFVVQGIAPKTVNAKLNDWWGSKGGLASATVFTHIDLRGYMSRWNYGF